MRKIAFIIPYFGKWPIWFPAFLKSCAYNSSIDWIFFTDCEIPSEAPPNTFFYATTLPLMEAKFTHQLGVPITLTNPIKFCDLKPTYGHVFQEQLKAYDFWGFCDIDIIWGDIRQFITDDLLNNYDLISSRKHTISGHFTLIRNMEYCNTLYRADDTYKELFVQEKYKWFDEDYFARLITLEKNKKHLRVYWEKYLVNNEKGRDSHQEYYLDKWLWDQGKLWDLKTDSGEPMEHLYLHFINWKVKMQACEEVSQSNTFYISYTGIHTKLHRSSTVIWNSIKNTFYGYYTREGVRKQKWKWKNLTKRGLRKAKKISDLLLS